MERLREIEERLSLIKEEIDKPDTDIEKLSKEVDELIEERNGLKAKLDKRKETREKINKGVLGEVIKRFDDKEKKEEFGADSKEYRSAWLKNLAIDAKGKKLFGDLTQKEERAFTFVTENTGAVVPTEILNRIVSLVDNDSPIYLDSSKSNMVFGFEIPRLKSIDAGDAKVVNEGEANDDEQDSFDNISLAGVEIKKHIVMSRKMQFQSIKAFEDWVVVHLSERIRVAKEKYIIKQLDKSESVGIDTANIITSSALTDSDLRKALGLLRGSGVRVLYANSNTIWNTIAGLENSSGEKLFIPSSMSDPLIEGRIYGTLIKRDSNIADDTFYMGYPSKILSNEFVAFDITPQIENKTLNRVFVGYSLFDAGLEDPKAFVKWTKGE